MSTSRREFLAGMGATGALAAASRKARALAGCPFRLAVINDEITQDFDHACYVASHDFGLNWIELRGMWHKNVTALNSDEIAESRKILAKYKLRVTDIASPLYKVAWPGAPLPSNRRKDRTFNADYTFKQQSALLERCIDLCKEFQTDRIRCFDFWRLEDGLIRENWVLVDLLDLYAQIGVDVFARLREFNKARMTGRIILPDGLS